MADESSPPPTPSPEGPPLDWQLANVDELRNEVRRLQIAQSEMKHDFQELRAIDSRKNQARAAALNLMEDAVEERRRAQELNERLIDEIQRREKAQAAERESEGRLRLALHAAAMGTFIWHAGDDRGEPDPQMLVLFGRPPTGNITLQEALTTQLHPEDRERYADAVRRAMDAEGDGRLREDIRILLPGGEWRWLAITGQVYFEGQPRRATRLAGAAIDITERKRSEQALRESEERQAFLLRLSDALRPLADPIEMQEAASRLLGERLGASRVGYAEAQPDGETVLVACHYTKGVPSLTGTFRVDDFGPGSLKEFRAGRTVVCPDIARDPRLSAKKKKAHAGRQLGATINKPLFKDGRLLAFLFLHFPEAHAFSAAEVALLEESAERTWAAMERARAEEALRTSEERLRLALEAAKAAARAKDHFLAVLSHELRTPLTPVLMAARALLRQKDLPASVQDALEMIVRNIGVERRLIDDLLDVTRIERGKLELQMEDVDVHAEVRRAVEICEADFREKKHELSVALEAGRYHLRGDALRLQQVFWNLLKNASKFTPEGGAIRVTSSEDAGRIVIRVADTGIGFAPEAVERIFDAFGQADVTVTRRFGGLGLGLAISMAVVRGHNGILRAESDGPDRGACFTVELPLVGENPRPAS